MTTEVAPSGRPRATVHINSKLEKQLLAYATVAGAAGVGLLAAAHTAEAKIVYTPLANVPIQNLQLDLNGDGAIDVSFKTWSTYHGAFEEVYPGAGGGIAYGQMSGNSGALPLPRQTRIGWKTKFSSFPEQVTGVDGCHGQCYSIGIWLNQTNKYLGVKFMIGGKPHFGWVRMTVGKALSGTASGYAYEDRADEPIIAGKTSGPDVVVRNASTIQSVAAPPRALQALGVLARGADTVAIWRREDEAAA